MCVLVASPRCKQMSLVECCPFVCLSGKVVDDLLNVNRGQLLFSSCHVFLSLCFYQAKKCLSPEFHISAYGRQYANDSCFYVKVPTVPQNSPTNSRSRALNGRLSPGALKFMCETSKTQILENKILNGSRVQTIKASDFPSGMDLSLVVT